MSYKNINQGTLRSVSMLSMLFPKLNTIIDKFLNQPSVNKLVSNNEVFIQAWLQVITTGLTCWSTILSPQNQSAKKVWDAGLNGLAGLDLDNCRLFLFSFLIFFGKEKKKSWWKASAGHNKKETSKPIFSFARCYYCSSWSIVFLYII